MFMPINGSFRVTNLVDSNDYLTISPFDLPDDTSAKPVVTLSITYIYILCISIVLDLFSMVRCQRT
jgi:hypothetical protein